MDVSNTELRQAILEELGLADDADFDAWADSRAQPAAAAEPPARRF